MITILRLEGSELRRVASSGEPVTEKFITRKQCEERGLLEPHRTHDDVLRAQLSGMTSDQLRNEMFLAGRHSVEGRDINRIGQQILEGREEAAARKEAELDAEKKKYHNIDGTSIPQQSF